MRSRPNLRWIGAAIGLLSVLALSACGDNGTETTPTPTAPAATTAAPTTAAASPQATTAEEITLAITASEENLTPWTQGSGYPGYYMMTLVYDTLFWIDVDGQPQPWLVEEFEVNDDGTVINMTLHDGVTFHDGEPLTSADVAFTIEYLLEHTRPRWSPSLTAISSVETPDDLTVVITLEEAQAGFIRRPLADMPIVPQHVWESVPDPTAVTEELPIGSGPYRMVEYAPEEVWRFEANTDYFLGEPVVGEIIMPFVATDQAALVAVRSGDADATSATLTPELVPEFEDAEGVELLRGPGFRGWYLYINTQRAPWDNVELRQALQSAIDLDEIVDVVLLGSAVPGSPGFVHRDIPWANPDTVDQTQDVDAANTLLDDLGFTDSDDDGLREADGEPISAEIIVDSDDAIAIRAVEMIAEWAGEVGLDLSPLSIEASEAGSRIWPDFAIGSFDPGDYTVANHSWAAAVQTDFTFLRALFHSDPQVGTLNRAAWVNEDYDALVDRMVATADEAERQDQLFQLQQMLADGVPMIPLYFPEDVIPYRPEAFSAWEYYTGVGILNKDAFLP